MKGKHLPLVKLSGVDFDAALKAMLGTAPPPKEKKPHKAAAKSAKKAGK